MQSSISRAFVWFWDPEHFGDRRVQACFVVLFCCGMIVWAMSGNTPTVITERVVDWSYITLLATVGIYHTARGLDEVMRDLLAKRDTTKGESR